MQEALVRLGQEALQAGRFDLVSEIERAWRALARVCRELEAIADNPPSTDRTE
jgi:hypothetical protein